MVGQAERTPAFQCYAAGALADGDGMTDQEFGLYWRLALHAWRDRGIPTDPARIARLLGLTPAKLAKMWPVVGARFVEQDGRLVLPWQEEQRDRPAPQRRAIPTPLRRQIYERDGHRCVECGSAEPLSLDHIHFYSRGGADTEENLRTLCLPCNRRRKPPRG